MDTKELWISFLVGLVIGLGIVLYMTFMQLENSLQELHKLDYHMNQLKHDVNEILLELHELENTYDE